jgi:enterochelin esterase-like enzyme
MKKIAVLLLVSATLATANPGDVPVTFSNRWDTVLGQEVFVLGSIPQLGNWVRNQSIKLVPSNCSGTTCDWTSVVFIPPGITYEYKFVKRYNCACCWDSPNISCFGRTDDASIVYEGGANRTGSTPALAAAPYSGKTVFYYSGWPSVSLLYSNTQSGSFTLAPMAKIQSSPDLWRVDNINRAGETNLIFVFTDNSGNYDNPSGPGTNYETPLDAFVVKTGNVYNYWPTNATVTGSRIETFTVTNYAGVAGRTVRVYLPRGYDQHTAKRYPVLYMQDGQNIFQGMGPSGGWNTDTNVDNLVKFGKMRETIVVGVDNGDRQCEYTPCFLPTVCTGHVTADNYADFLIHNVKEKYIDPTYRTLADADNTGVMGSSRGGLISVYLAWEYSDVFHKLGALSPSFWACATTKDNLALPPKRPIRVYLDTGTVGDFPSTTPPCNPCYDGIAYTMTARDNLLKNGYRLNDDFDQAFGFGNDHNEFYWARRSPRAYTFLFPTRDEPNTVLETVLPVRLTNYQRTGGSNVVTWISLRPRTYTVEASTNFEFAAGMTWSNVATTLPEELPWNYPTLALPESFHFLRVRQNGD